MSDVHEVKGKKPKAKLGVRTFKAGESAKARGENRRSGRNITRKNGRKEAMKFIFDEQGLIPLEESSKENYLRIESSKKNPVTIWDIPYEDIADYVIENVIHIQTKNVYTRQTSNKDRHNAYIAVCSAVQDKIYSWSKVQGYKYSSFKGYRGLFETLAYCSLLMEQSNIIQSLGLKRTLKSSSVDSNKNLVKIIPLNKKGRVESCR